MGLSLNTRVAHETPLLLKLHWLLVCFQVQFKGCLSTLKPFITWVQVTRETVSKELAVPLALAGMLQTPSVREFWLAVSRRRAFSARAPILWNIVPPEMRSILIFLTFQKCLKTYFCQLAWGPDGVFHSGGG